MDFPKLSTFPARKIQMDCEHCGIHVRYDRDACIRTGGDRTLLAFREDVRARKGCKGYNPSGNPTLTTCALVYSELWELQKAKRTDG